jgi:dipeptidyl-peptidase 4
MLKKKGIKLCLWMLLVSLAPQVIYAQVTEKTYQKAAYFLSGNIQKQVYHLEVIPNWTEDGKYFWHLTQTASGKRFFITDIEKQSSREAFDHAKLAEVLSQHSNAAIDASLLPFDRIRIIGENEIRFEYNHTSWEFNLKDYTLTKDKTPAKSQQQGISPDGKWRAFTRDYNLFVENLENGQEVQLSKHGKKDFEYGSYYGWSDLIKGENGVRPERFMVRWSPDSKKILTQIVDLRLGEKMYLLDFSEPEKFRPTLYSYYRGSPGDTTVVTYIPVLFDVVQQKETAIPSLTSPHFIGIDLNWDKGGNTLSGTYSHRGFKQLDYIEVEASSGKIRNVHTEKSDTYLSRDLNFHRKLADGRFLVSSQASGWNHLYLHDWKSGNRMRQLTSGNYAVSEILHVDEQKEWVYFMANGREKEDNIYHPKLYKVKLDGSGLTLLTQEKAFHELHVSPNRKYVVDNISTPQQPTQSVLRSLESGEILMEISKADISNLVQKGYQSPKPFKAIAKDGKTEIYGIYYVPTDFDPSKSYPILDYTYTGPHTAITPKTFKTAVIGLQQSMAELGMIVVTVDGLGTAGRSKAFADVSYRNLGDGTTDHVLAIQQLAIGKPFMDLDRVGIFGHSAGGYDAARAMLLHPDFYKVGVASAGDHDHRMEKAWWPEMYMGYPVGAYYHEQSNITQAAKLKGRLLLAHGTLDENVNPSATFKFAEALIAAGKDFDLFIWPSRNHSFGRTNGDYFTKKRWDYFIEHLIGLQPLRHYTLEID